MKLLRKYVGKVSLGMYYGMILTSHSGLCTHALLQHYRRASFRSSVALQPSPVDKTAFSLNSCKNGNHDLSSSIKLSTLEIHRTIQTLVKKQDELPQPTSLFVLQVLERWAIDYGNASEWRSLLNKDNLFPEIEESIIAIHELREWSVHSTNSDIQQSQSLIVLDACCGKGVYSTLLSYLAPTNLFPRKRYSVSVFKSIIALDKDPKINWNHVHAANSNHEEESRPNIHIWSPSNLFDLDTLVEKLLDQVASSDVQIAMNGIHLCKTLSPAFIGLANSLGSETVPFLCIAPCCLPRLGQPLIIAQYESPMQREARQLQIRLRQRQLPKEKRQIECFVCQGNHHVRNCPERENYKDENQWNELVRARLLSRSKRCWKCGQEGHAQSECQNVEDSTTTPRRGGTMPPRQILQMSKDFLPTESDPSLQRYCNVLASAIQGGPEKQVKLVNANLMQKTSQIFHEDPDEINGGRNNNWNRHRKSLFLVVTR